MPTSTLNIGVTVGGTDHGATNINAPYKLD